MKESKPRPTMEVARRSVLISAASLISASVEAWPNRGTASALQAVDRGGGQMGLGGVGMTGRRPRQCWRRGKCIATQTHTFAPQPSPKLLATASKTFADMHSTHAGEQNTCR